MTEEMRKKVDHIHELHKVELCAKAMYITGGYIEMMDYLDVKVEYEVITEDESRKIIDKVINGLAWTTTVGQFDYIREMIKNLGKI